MTDSGLTYKEKLSKTLDEFLSFIVDLLKDLQENNLTNFSPDAVTIARTLLKQYDVLIVMEALQLIDDKWYMVDERNEEFLTVHIVSAFDRKSIPLDTSLLTFPFTVYNKIKGMNKYKDMDKDEWPLCDDDIELIWRYVKSMVTLTENYFLEEGVKSLSVNNERSEEVV